MMTTGTTAPATAAPGTAAPERDRAALDALFAQLLATWSAGDADAYADLFVADLTYVGFDGFAFRGREQLRSSHDELFRGVLRGSRLVGQVDDVRRLGPDVAVLHCSGAVVTRGRTRPGRGRWSVQTIVAVRAGTGWMFTDFHNSRYRPLPRLVTWYMRRAARRSGAGRPAR